MIYISDEPDLFEIHGHGHGTDGKEACAAVTALANGLTYHLTKEGIIGHSMTHGLLTVDKRELKTERSRFIFDIFLSSFLYVQTGYPEQIKII